MEIGFNPIFDDLARDRSLTSTEKLFIAHILRFGCKGCYESKPVLSTAMGIDQRTLERVRKGLYVKQWVTIDYSTKPATLYITTEKLKTIRVWGSLTGCGKPVSLAVKTYGIYQNQGRRFGALGRRFVQIGAAFCHLFYRKRGDLSYNKRRENRVKEKISSIISEERKKEKRPLSKAEFEARRIEYHKQLEKK